MTRATRIAFWALLFSLPLLAQQCLSLTGTWRMNRAHSFFAGMKNPSEQAENETLVIVQNGSSVQESWTFEGSHIHEQVSYSFAVDGTEQKINNAGKSRQAPASVRAEWQNCTLIVDKKMFLYGLFTTDVKNTYVLSNQGKRLTILQESHTAFAESERRLVFDRQGVD